MFKATGRLGKSTAEATRARTAQQRGAQRNNLHAAQRNISPIPDDPVDVPVVEKVNRADRLKLWRIEKEKKKQQDAATKKKPFVTVVKKGVFLDTTNYIDFNKKFRQKSEAKKKDIKKAATNPVTPSHDQTSSSELTVSSTLPMHVTGEDHPFEVLNRPEDENVGMCADESTENENENGESELNSTFEVLTLTGNKQPKIESVRDTVPNNNDEASSSSEINRVHKTPIRTSLSTSLNTSLNYVSPFVTVSRGKRSAKKENNVRESLYKLETSQPGILSPITRQNREAAAYFRNQVNSETERLTQTTNIWTEYKEMNSHIDSVYIDQIDVAIGQTRLLIAKKFNQFLNLIDQCENASGEKSVYPKDLEGFWSMVYMQVENCNERFFKLENLKSNNWIEVGLTPVKVEKKQKKTKVHKKGQGVSASSGIQQMMEAAREKLKESKRPLSASSNSKESTYSMHLRQTPARRSSTPAIAQTPKSIIKTPGVRRNAKNVVFAAIDSASGTPSPNHSSAPTPKASMRSRRASTSRIPMQSGKQNISQRNVTFSTPQYRRIVNDQSSSLRRSRRIPLFSTTSDT